MPASAGASAIHGRFRYQLESVSAFENEVSFNINIRGVALRSRGDHSEETEDVEFLFANPKTGQFTNTRGSGHSSRVGADWVTIHRSVSLDQRLELPSREMTEAFLKEARLYVIGTRHGGTITLPYEIPEMLLEVKR